MKGKTKIEEEQEQEKMKHWKKSLFGEQEENSKIAGKCPFYGSFKKEKKQQTKAQTQINLPKTQAKTTETKQKQNEKGKVR